MPNTYPARVRVHAKRKYLLAEIEAESHDDDIGRRRFRRLPIIDDDDDDEHAEDAADNIVIPEELIPLVDAPEAEGAASSEKFDCAVDQIQDEAEKRRAIMDIIGLNGDNDEHNHLALHEEGEEKERPEEDPQPASKRPKKSKGRSFLQELKFGDKCLVKFSNEPLRPGLFQGRDANGNFTIATYELDADWANLELRKNVGVAGGKILPYDKDQMVEGFNKKSESKISQSRKDYYLAVLTAFMTNV